MRAKAEEQISAFLENKPGVVANLCATLSEHHINIKALTVLETVDIGTLRMVVENVGHAKEVLRDAGAAYVIVPVITIPIPNRPGAFAQIARSLAQAGINIEYCYATAQPDTDHSIGIFRVSDFKKALELQFED